MLGATSNAFSGGAGDPTAVVADAAGVQAVATVVLVLVTVVYALVPLVQAAQEKRRARGLLMAHLAMIGVLTHYDQERGHLPLLDHEPILAGVVSIKERGARDALFGLAAELVAYSAAVTHYRELERAGVEFAVGARADAVDKTADVRRAVDKALVALPKKVRRHHPYQLDQR